MELKQREDLRLILHREIPDDPVLRRQWNELVFAMESPQVFYTYEWALAVNRAYKDSVTPLLWLGYEGERLVGVAALAESVERPRCSFFLTASTGDYCDLICAPANAETFCEATLSDLRRRGYKDAILANAPADSPAIRALLAMAGRFGYHLYSRTAYNCAQIALGDDEQRRELRSSITRRQLVRRQIASMSKIAAVSVEHDRECDQVTSFLPEFFRMHVARFLGMGRVSNLVRPERRAFLRQVTSLLSAKGWMVNSRLMLGNTPVAFNFGFSFGGSWFWYQPTFQCRAMKHSPGLCLLSRIVADACDTPHLQLVDLGLGAEEYKDRFSNRSTETLYITLHTSKVFHLKEVLRHRSTKLASSSAAFDAFLRRLRDRIFKARERGLRHTGKAILNTLCRGFFSEDEVLFYQWSAPSSVESAAFRLKPLEIEDLADAAMEHCDDSETQAYLFRAAERLQAGQAHGYVLLAGDHHPVHFCWVTDFNGFYMAELDHVLSAPDRNLSLIFDCWTPRSARGNNHYPRAISMLAAQVNTNGSRPWIFGAKSNDASIGGIVRAGFELQFSIVRKRVLFRRRLMRSSVQTSSSGWDQAIVAA